MKIEWGKLLEGTINSIFIKEQVEAVAKERIEICKVCEHYSPNIPNLKATRTDKFCVDCGCNMYLKTRALSAFCPLGSETSHFPLEKSRWSSVADDKISEQLQDTKELKEQLTEYKLKLMHNKTEE